MSLEEGTDLEVFLAHILRLHDCMCVCADGTYPRLHMCTHVTCAHVHPANVDNFCLENEVTLKHAGHFSVLSILKCVSINTGC